MIKPFRGDHVLTQEFGKNPSTYARFGLLGHNGLDYGLPSNTQIIAPHNGKIIEASVDPSGYGLYIKIENGKEGSVLAHLATFQVKVGDNVSEGQPIALSDNTGFSTGPHLHWGYYLFPRDRTNGYLGYIDQLPILNVVPLPEPNPGYAPTFSGQTVSKDGRTYQSYMENGKLLWRIAPTDPSASQNAEIVGLKKEVSDLILANQTLAKDYKLLATNAGACQTSLTTANDKIGKIKLIING